MNVFLIDNDSLNSLSGLASLTDLGGLFTVAGSDSLCQTSVSALIALL